MSRPSDANADQRDLFEHIDQLSQDFRREWKAGQTPRIEAYLGQVPNHAQEALFRALLPLDIRYRERQGERARADDYWHRFPKFKRVIGDAFHQSTSFPNEGGFDSPEREDAERTATLEAPTDRRLGMYDLLGEIGRGAFGVVFEAKHRERGDRVALKTLPPLLGEIDPAREADRLRRFRREFRSLAEINHPNLVGMQSLEVDGDRWFFTMDLIDGHDFKSYVRPQDQLHEARLRPALEQLIRGIVALHERRILHRDLKPSNVLVDREGRVVVLDFGLVAELEARTDQTATLASRQFAGTPRYAAPEQAFGHRSPASDWYALGTMLYEALTGEPPFAGTASELLIRKQNEAAPSLAGRENLPRDLAELTDRLLHREPDQRPTTSEIVSHLKMDLRSTFIDSASTSHGDELEGLAKTQDVFLVGRDQELQRLKEITQEWLAARRPRTVFITGKSGEGKSSLAEVFLRPLQESDDCLVLSGRCYERESVPFKALDSWIDELASFLRRQSSSWLTDHLPHDAGGLGQIFPLLQKIEAIRDLPRVRSVVMNQETVRHRSLVALAELIHAIGRERSVVIFIDDLQWGDADSVDCLIQIVAPTAESAVLFLGSYRSDERDSSPFFDRWDQMEVAQHADEVASGPLNEAEIRELSTHLLPSVELSDTDVQRLRTESNGNPYLVTQLIENFDPQGGGIRSLSLADIIKTRLDRLPREATALLDLVAVAGQAIPLELAFEAVDLQSSSYPILTRMRNEKLVGIWKQGEQLMIDTLHDKVRETVFAQMPADTRQALHLKLARLLEQRAGVAERDWEAELAKAASESPLSEPILFLSEIADHYHAARHPRALAYLILAGQQALQAFSHAEALECFQRAGSLATNQTESRLRFHIAVGSGLSFLRSRQLAEAIETLTPALSLASQSKDRIEVYAALANAYGSQGKHGKAIEYGKLALAKLGCSRPEGRLQQLLSITTKLTSIWLLPEKFLRRHQGRDRQEILREVEVLQRLKMDLVQKSTIENVESWMRQVLVGFQANDRQSTALACSNAAMGFAFIGLFGLARRAEIRYRESAIEPSEAPELVAIASWNEGLTAYFSSDLRKVETPLKRSIEHAARCGDHTLHVFSWHVLRHAYHWIASVTQELETGRTEFHVASSVGDAKGCCWASYGQAEACARGGRFAEGLPLLQQAYEYLKIEPWYSTEPVCRGVHGYLLLQASRHSDVCDTIRPGWEMARSTFNLHMFNVYPIVVALQAIFGPEWLSSPSNQDRILRRHLVRWTRFAYFAYPVIQVPALRALGRWQASQGRKTKAQRLFTRAARKAEQRGMPTEHARALLDLAAVKEADRQENRQQAIELLKDMEAVIPRAESWLLGDQYDEAVVAPEFDVEAWEREHGPVDAARQVNDPGSRT